MSEHGAAPAELLVLLQSCWSGPVHPHELPSSPCMFLVFRRSETKQCWNQGLHCGSADLLLKSGHVNEFF